MVVDSLCWVSVSESEQLADTFATIARELEAATGPGRTQEVVTRHAVEQVPGCAYAAISLVRRGGAVSTVAATDEIAERVDQRVERKRATSGDEQAEDAELDRPATTTRHEGPSDFR